ncbi:MULTISPECIES: hypothetical protein, partial [unclassified Fibrobacter]|uniref:hypothetical protein n=1 Tax=unclassified Fibrobacter TaxID=2634177 RepID=UPI000D79B38E
FYIAWHAKTNKDGIKGTRSTYGFSGTNYTGLSLTGAGARDPEDATFVHIERAFYWFYPAEFDAQPDMGAYANYVSGSVNNAVTYGSGEYKKAGYSVRCVKVE